MVKVISFGGWNLNVMDDAEFISANEKQSLKKIVAGYFEKEVVSHPGKWGYKTIGISPVVRVDYCIGPNGDIFVYEIEARPAGQGVLCCLADLEGIGPEHIVFPGTMNESVILVGKSKHHQLEDSVHWAKKLGVPLVLSAEEALSSGKKIWCRVTPDDFSQAEISRLHKISLVPIRHDGHKGYLPMMELAKIVPKGNVDMLPWDINFVVKPLCGAEGHDVMFWYNGEKGACTRTKIENLVRKTRTVLQPLVIHRDQQERCVIDRVFLGHFPNTEKTWRVIGGIKMSRPNLKVHGSGDTEVSLLLP